MTSLAMMTNVFKLCQANEMRYSVLLLLLAGTVSGCVPWPHFVYVAPAVEGTITNNGVPAQGAQVTVQTHYPNGVLSADSDKKDRLSAKSTPAEVERSDSDDKGRFATKPIKEFTPFMFFPQDRLFGYSVSIKFNEMHYSGLGYWGMSWPPKKIRIACELSKPSKGESKYCEIQDRE